MATLDPAKLVPWDRNPRINDHAVSTVVGLIQRFGFASPVIAWKPEDPRIIAGHTRRKAALELGLAEVPVRFMPHLSWDEAQALAIADNKSGEIADWDEAELAAILKELDGLDVSIDDLGFSDEEMDELLDREPPEEPEQEEGANEPPANPTSVRGEVYALGPHRLMCGDSTSAEDVHALIWPDVPNLMVTDPPYGVDYQGGEVNKAKRERLAGDDSTDLFAPALGLAAEFMPTGAWYVWHSGRLAAPVHEAISSAGWSVRALVIWNKLNCGFAAPSRHYLQAHEPCLYAVKGTALWIGSSKERSVWDIEQPNRNEHHPTQKPLECMERPIRNHEGDVYDPFLGSGTTLIAAARQGRKCYGMEISPAYCDVIRKRWGDYARANDLDAGADAL